MFYLAVGGWKQRETWPDFQTRQQAIVGCFQFARAAKFRIGSRAFARGSEDLTETGEPEVLNAMIASGLLSVDEALLVAPKLVAFLPLGQIQAQQALLFDQTGQSGAAEDSMQQAIEIALAEDIPVAASARRLALVKILVKSGQTESAREQLDQITRTLLPSDRREEYDSIKEMLKEGT